MTRLLYVTLLAVSLASATPLSTYHEPSRQRAGFTLAPLVAEEHPHGTVNNSYIVMLKDGIEPALMQNHMNFLQNVHASDPSSEMYEGLTHVYDAHVKGYAGKFSEATVEQLRMMPEVEYVEKDQIVRTLEVERIEVEKHATQKKAPWVSFQIFRVLGRTARAVYRSTMRYSGGRCSCHPRRRGARLLRYTYDSSDHTTHFRRLIRSSGTVLPASACIPDR